MNGKASPSSRARWRARWAMVGLLVPIAVMLGAVSASAQRGVAVDVGRIDVEEALQLGQTYTLPTIEVRNPGSVASKYVMGVGELASASFTPPQSWLSFDPPTLRLSAGDKQPVTVTLTIPLDAAPGDYESLLAAELAADGVGARVGVSAATRLTFRVATTGSPWDVPTWAWLLLLLVGAAAAVRLLGRRFRFQVQRR